MAEKTRREQIEAMLNDDPADPFLNYGLAMEFVSTGDDAAAVRQFQSLIEVAADYVPAYLMAGQALVRLDRVAEARTLLQKGMEAAKAKPDQHAWEEMNALLDTLS